MRCELVANASVSRYRVFAEMAWLEKRPELGLLCRIASSDNNGAITTSIVERVLPGVSEVSALNVLAWCQSIGLCDRQGILSQAGHAAADDDNVPVPEQGTFDLWVIGHPLTGIRILHAARRGSTQDGRLEDVVDLQLESGRVFASLIDPKSRFILRSGAKASDPVKGIVRETTSHCQVVWDLDFEAERDEWHLEGNLDDGGLYPSYRESSAINLGDLFVDWARGPLEQQGRWNQDQRRFLVTFDKPDRLTELEQDTFKKSFQIPKVRAGAYGEFDNVSIYDVPIGPATSDDATQWANARLERKLYKPNDSLVYRSRNDLRRLFVELIAGTPLEPAAAVLPSHDEFLERHRPSPQVYWSLAAGVDLAPVKPTTEEMSSLTGGQETLETPLPSPEGPSDHKTVRVPYRGGWSMAELLARLLDAGPPRAVLLCDRYIASPAQRGSLKLLSAALCAVHATVTFDVITQTNVLGTDTIGAIGDIIGPNGKLRGYQHVFGSIRRHQPHARYFLVIPAASAELAYGWQMDNSPLDGLTATDMPATPNTPLEWRDFSAVRLRAEEVPAELAKWFAGARL